MELRVIWNHVGKEHGGMNYTRNIKRNSKETINKAIQLKEEKFRSEKYPNQFIRYDDDTIVELPPLYSNRKFIIIYCKDTGLQYSLNYKSRYPWWLIDVIEMEEIKPNIFISHDLFIDISINLDGSYQVLDMDEYNKAIELEVIPKKTILSSLNSLHFALEELNNGKFPSERIKEIQKKYYKK